MEKNNCYTGLLRLAQNMLHQTLASMEGEMSCYINYLNWELPIISINKIHISTILVDMSLPRKQMGT